MGWRGHWQQAQRQCCCSVEAAGGWEGERTWKRWSWPEPTFCGSSGGRGAVNTPVGTFDNKGFPNRSFAKFRKSRCEMHELPSLQVFTNMVFKHSVPEFCKISQIWFQKIWQILVSPQGPSFARFRNSSFASFRRGECRSPGDGLSSWQNFAVCWRFDSDHDHNWSV